MFNSIKFIIENTDVNTLMCALDKLDLEKNQNWDDESTTWLFNDGSFITIQGSDIIID